MSKRTPPWLRSMERREDLWPELEEFDQGDWRTDATTRAKGRSLRVLFRWPSLFGPVGSPLDSRMLEIASAVVLVAGVTLLAIVCAGRWLR